MTYKMQFWRNAGVYKYFLPRHLILYVNVTPLPPPISNPAVCNISSELLYQEVRRDNTDTSGFQTIDSYVQFNHSTQHRHQMIPMLTNRRISPLLILQAGLPKFRDRGLFLNIPRLSTERREYGNAKWVESRRGNVKRSTRKTFASADCNENDRVNLDEEKNDHMSEKHTNASRDWEKRLYSRIVTRGQRIFGPPRKFGICTQISIWRRKHQKIIYGNTYQWVTRPRNPRSSILHTPLRNFRR